MSISITTAAPASTVESAAALLAYQSVQSGTPTDFNVGSQVRTLAEGIGAIAEQEGVIAQALALQAMVYGACSVFGVSPLGASYAAGTVTFMTGSLTSSPPAQQSVVIAPGFIVQTDGAVQYQTTQTATLAIGATGVDVPVSAVVAGQTGNASKGLISTIVSNASYPLSVTNQATVTGGDDAETPSQTLTRLLSVVASLRLGTPVSIANFAIGIAAGVEVVRYATVFEAWIEQPINQQTAGFELLVDNGSGAASAALLAAVTTALNGSLSGGQSGNRAAGVPFSVVAVTPVPYSVSVTATLTDTEMEGALTTALATALNTYQASLQFGAPPESAQITAAVAGALSGYITSLQVNLVDATGASVSSVAVGSTQRAQLTTITPVFS